MLTRQQRLVVDTGGRGFTELTRQVRAFVASGPVRTGLCHLFVQHTSASLIIGENADPDVLRDLEAFMADRVPDGDPLYRHTAEGPDDMPAHVRSVLTATTLSVPVSSGQLALGTWQGIFLWEHRHRGHQRTVILTLQGEPE